MTALPTIDEYQNLRVKLREVFGDQASETLMSILPFPTDGGFATNARLTTEMATLRTEMAELRTELKTEMAELRTELKTEMADLRVELKAEMGDLRSEMRAEMSLLRSDLHRDITAFATSQRNLFFQITAMMATLSGLIVLLIRL